MLSAVYHCLVQQQQFQNKVCKELTESRTATTEKMDNAEIKHGFLYRLRTRALSFCEYY